MKKTALILRSQTSHSRRQILITVGILLITGTSVGHYLGWLQILEDFAISTAREAQPGLYRVESFEDGDTISINMNGTIERIRFIGVDTPETKDPRKPVQCFGKAASAFTKNLIGYNPIRLEADPLNTNRDRYNRLLRYIYLPDGRLVNAEIIRQGYGFAYTSFPFTKSEEFINYQTEARQAGRGLWSQCQTIENQYGGNSTAPE